MEEEISVDVLGGPIVCVYICFCRFHSRPGFIVTQNPAFPKGSVYSNPHLLLSVGTLIEMQTLEPYQIRTRILLRFLGDLYPI